MNQLLRAGVMIAVFLPAASGVAAAQGASTASIAGTVRDTSGAVLPGVTIEAASPALIERVRTTVSDDRGDYRIIQLRPGTYTITFTLPGFSNFIREGLELPVAFTATVHAEMTVGGLEESVTVSGESPLVDVQNVADHTTISRDQIDALPSNRTLYTYTALSPAIVVATRTQDVGGSQGETRAAMSVHGSRVLDQKLLQDGMRVGNLTNSGSGRGYVTNPLAASEFVVELGGGGSAEQSTAGAQINLIPKDGANNFTGTFFVSGSGHALQADNLTSELKAQGLSAVNTSRAMYDFNFVGAGPIMQNRLWFISAHRIWGRDQGIGDLFEDSNLDDWAYTPDRTRPVVAPERNRAHNGRLTWQASSKDKITGSYDWQYYHGSNNQGGLGATVRSWEVRGNKYCPATNVQQATWTRPQSNTVLFEAGVTRLVFDLKGVVDGAPGCDDNPGRTSVTEQNTAVAPTLWHGTGTYSDTYQLIQNARASMSYVSGAHNTKFGMFLIKARETAASDRRSFDVNSLPVSYTFNSGVPVQLTQFVSPFGSETHLTEFALFAQDQWTIDRLTINAGLRFEYLSEEVPALSLAAGVLSDARTFDAVTCIPCWKDVSPRVSVAYDLFGDGTTAVKGSFGRYSSANTIEVAQMFAPVTATVSSTNRSWTDTNRNFFPDCNLRNVGLNGECGPMANASFGQTVVRTRPDPDWIEGWGQRPYNHLASLSMERQLWPGTAVNVGYFRRWYGNQSVADNLLVAPTDYDPYCVTAPTDSRLGDVSGSRVCGLFDIRPGKFGQVDSVVGLASEFGEFSETFTGIDVGFQARLPRGASVNGGFAIGNSVGTNATVGSNSVKSNSCFVVDSPQQLYNCESDSPLRTQLKVNGSIPLFWGLQAAAVFQSLPGANYQALTTFPVDQIQPSLGRPLSGNVRNVTIDLLQPFSTFAERVTQIDLRLSKTLTVGAARLQVNADVYNVANQSAVLNLNGSYGTNWLVPVQVLDARLVKFGVQVDF